MQKLKLAVKNYTIYITLLSKYGMDDQLKMFQNPFVPFETIISFLMRRLLRLMKREAQYDLLHRQAPHFSDD